ncbi:MAG: hypothetical protein IT185_08460 [Acidobacteria bacterium]|nr:hypothetical protein [Acidobacteriota bacterium]
MSMTPDEITRAARTMIAGDPPPDLQARITRRLDAESQSRPAVTGWRVVAAMATAVATVVIVFAVRSSEGPGSRGPEVRGEVPAVRGPEVPESAISPSPQLPISTSPQLPISTPTRLPSYRSLSAAELDWMARRIPALEMIEPLAVDRMTTQSIQPEAMLITPLTITPLGASPIAGDPDTGRQH